MENKDFSEICLCDHIVMPSPPPVIKIVLTFLVWERGISTQGKCLLCFQADRERGQRAFLTSAFSQLLFVQNNSYAKTAYLGWPILITCNAFLKIKAILLKQTRNFFSPHTVLVCVGSSLTTGETDSFHFASLPSSTLGFHLIIHVS